MAAVWRAAPSWSRGPSPPPSTRRLAGGPCTITHMSIPLFEIQILTFELVRLVRVDLIQKLSNFDRVAQRPCCADEVHPDKGALWEPADCYLTSLTLGLPGPSPGRERGADQLFVVG